MSTQAKPKTFYFHLVSDATGSTLQGLTRAALVQFSGVSAQERYWPLIRTEKQLQSVLKEIEKKPGPVFFTFVEPKMRRTLKSFCDKRDIPCIAVLDPILKALSSYTGQRAKGIPGAQHAMDEDYFKRVDAIDFAMGFDDGQVIDGLEDADVILVGVSRTSKTPTCVYLARRGIKAGNIPLVPGVPFPEKVLEFKRPFFVGLTESTDRLLSLRASRLKSESDHPSLFKNAYLDPEAVEDEIKRANKLFKENKWPIIDVTRRSIEETAAEIIVLLQKRKARHERDNL